MTGEQKKTGCRPHETAVTVGANLRFYRKRAKLSQKQAAGLIGISYQQMQKYERGMNRICAEYMFVLKSAYGVRMEDFFREVDLSGDRRRV